MKYVYRSTGSGAISESIAIPNTEARLSEVRLTMDGASATEENLVISIDSGAGANYDHVLSTQDTNGSTWLRYKPTRPDDFGHDLSSTKVLDKLVITHTNTDANTWGLEVIFV